MRAKLIRWAVFGVLFAVIPFVGSALAWNARYHHTAVPFYFYYLWERGELLIVSAGFAADAVGECISPRNNFLTIRLVMAGICILVLFYEAIWFALLQFTVDAYDPAWITGGSVILFIVTLIVALTCKICSGLAEGVKA